MAKYYIDPTYTDSCTGTRHLITEDLLEYNVNAFASLVDAANVISDGDDLYVNGVLSDISIPKHVNIHLTGSTANTLVIGQDVNVSTSGDISTSIENSTFAVNDSYVVGNTGSHDGDIGVLLTDSTIGDGRYTRQFKLMNNYTFTGEGQTISLTIQDSVIRDDINMLSSSTIGTAETPAMVVLTLERVTVPADKWFWITNNRMSGSSYANVVFNLTDSVFGSGNEMSVAVHHNSGNTSAFLGDVTNNVNNIQFSGRLTPVRTDTYSGKQYNNPGTFTFNVTGGSSFVNTVRGFDVINIVENSVLSVKDFSSNKVLNVSGELRTASLTVSELHLFSGGRITGRILLNESATVVAEAGSEIAIDLTKEDPGSQALVNNLSIFQGTPDFSVSVCAIQGNGSYTLANKATSFTGVLTVRDISDDSVLGTLSLANPTGNILGKDYMLNLSDGVLSLSVAGNMAFSDITMSDGQRTTLCDGDSAENVVVANGAMLHVESGGTGSGIQVMSSGYLYVSSGGLVQDLKTDSYGYVTVLSGGLIESAYLSGGIRSQMATVGRGGILSSAKVLDGVDLYVSGSAIDIQLLDGKSNDSTDLFLRSGGYESNVTVGCYGNVDIYGYCTAVNTEVSSGGRLVASYGGMVSGLELFDSGSANLFSASARNVLIHPGGSMEMKTSGTVEVVTIESGASFMIGSGIRMNEAEVRSGGSLSVVYGATASNITIDAGGHVNGFTALDEKTILADIASISNLSVEAGSKAFVYGGQNIDNVVVSSGAFLYVSSGGHVANVEVKAGGRLMAYAADSLENITAEAGAELNGFFIPDPAFYSDNPFIENALILSGNTASVFDGQAIGVNQAQSGGSLNGFVFQSDVTISGVTISDVHVDSNATAYLYAGQRADNVLVGSRCGLIVSSGASVSNAEIVMSGAMTVSSGGSASDIIVQSGQLFVVSRGYASGVILRSREDRKNGDIYIQRGAVVENVEIGEFADCYVETGATMRDAVVKSSAYVSVYQGIVEKLLVNSGGSVFVNWGGTATFLFTPWQGIVTSDYGASITFLERDANVYYGGDSYGLIGKADSYDSLSITSGNSAIVYSDGALNSVYVNEGGVLNVLSGGTANILYTPWSGTIVAEDGATMTVEREAGIYYGNDKDGIILKADTIASFTVEAGNSAIIYADGSATDLLIRSGGCLMVETDGTAENVYVNRNGTIIVSNGATATVEYNPWSGTVIAEEGADVTRKNRDAKVYYGGDASGIIWKGDLNDGLTVTSDNHAIVYDGGVMRDTIIQDSGVLEMLSGGTAESIYVNRNGTIIVSNGATAAVEYNPWSGTVIAEEGADVIREDRDANVYYGCDASGIIRKGDSFDDLTVTSGCSAIVYDGGVMKDTVVNNSGALEVQSGGTAEIAFNPWSGAVTVAEGGTITNLSRSNNVYYGGAVSGLISRCDEMDGLSVTSGNSVIVSATAGSAIFGRTPTVMCSFQAAERSSTLIFPAGSETGMLRSKKAASFLPPRSSTALTCMSSARHMTSY